MYNKGLMHVTIVTGICMYMMLHIMTHSNINYLIYLVYFSENQLMSSSVQQLISRDYNPSESLDEYQGGEAFCSIKVKMDG